MKVPQISPASAFVLLAMLAVALVLPVSSLPAQTAHNRPSASTTNQPERFQVDTFDIHGAGPYQLTHKPDRGLELKFVDGMLAGKDSAKQSGQLLTLRPDQIHLGWYRRLTVVYTY